MKDVRIGLFDKSFIHLSEAEIRYIPNVEHPQFVDIESKHIRLRLPYHFVDYITLDKNTNI